MNIGHQSQATLDVLFRGGSVRSGTVSVGPYDQKTVMLLQLLIEKFDELSSRRGEDQARALYRAYTQKLLISDNEKEATEGTITEDGPHAALRLAEADEGANASIVRPGWRLHELRCRSIRGLAPVGEEFVFEFDGATHLIYGPNGSGKTSLVGTTGWVLTGRFLTDVDDGGEEKVPLYSPEVDGKASKKLCDWPSVHTLPVSCGDVRKVVPDGWAQIQLRSRSGDIVWLRRRVGGECEVSHDGANWTRCPRLADLGIESLDVQLSLVAPSVFSRFSLEGAQDAGRLISLLLGYDALEALGDVIGNLARNRTMLAKSESEERNSKLEEFRRKLSSAIELLPENSTLRNDVSKLAVVPLPPIALIEECSQSIMETIETSESHLADLIGVTNLSVPSVGLADALTHALKTLERGFDYNFPSFGKLNPRHLRFPQTGSSPLEQWVACSAALDDFLTAARRRIEARLKWWRDENRTGSKAALLLQAAKFVDAEHDGCPVCEKPFNDPGLRQKLERLRPSGPDLSRSVRDFFRDLEEELRRIVPENLGPRAQRSPAECLTNDWERLSRETLGPRLASVASPYEGVVRLLANKMMWNDEVVANFIPDDADPEFLNHGANFVRALSAAKASLFAAHWSISNYESAEREISAVILDPPAEGSRSLLGALARGKDAAESVKPLTFALKAVADAKLIQGSVADLEACLNTLEELAGRLDSLKLLPKFATSEAARTLEAIKVRTIEIQKLLYPETPNNLSVSRLVLGSGKTKTVAAYLADERFETPSEPFANAGQRRAIALAFFFALLDRHPGGLGFIILDDPLLSLDDEHRESWSRKVLLPRMDDYQVIVATHQRQYLNHCRQDFRCGRVIELNTRRRSQRLSWRPGNRLDHADNDFQTSGMDAFNGLRKYVEDLLLTFNTYSPEPFFNGSQWRPALEAFAAIKRPHPLAGEAQREIAEILNGADVGAVLNAGSHAATEGDLTEAIFLRCLEELRKCDKVFRKELDRLDRLRIHASRNVALPQPTMKASKEGTQGGANSVSAWIDRIPIQVIGMAAAQTRGCVVDIVEKPRSYSLEPGEAVLVNTSALEPLVSPGQWAILAPEEDSPESGDIVAVEDGNRFRWLRRVWTDGDRWIMESVNPVAAIPAVSVRKVDVSLRKVVGTLFEPSRPPGQGRARRPAEWQPRGDFDPKTLARMSIVTIDGTSLEPIARHGQAILVGEKVSTKGSRLIEGSLAVIETDDDLVGNVVKSVFMQGDKLVLISPNTVEPHNPIVVSAGSITAVWPVKGVLRYPISIE